MSGPLSLLEQTGNLLNIGAGSNGWLFNTYPLLSQNPNNNKCLGIRGLNIYGNWTNTLHYFDLSGNFWLNNNLQMGPYILTQQILSSLISNYQFYITSVGCINLPSSNVPSITQVGGIESFTQGSNAQDTAGSGSWYNILSKTLSTGSWLIQGNCILINPLGSGCTLTGAQVALSTNSTYDDLLSYNYVSINNVSLVNSNYIVPIQLTRMISSTSTITMNLNANITWSGAVNTCYFSNSTVMRCMRIG